ncbi:MAG: hypothetical protein KGL39_33700 [Patescibacteria group bacterium]|nr:hypothetical protein [Patescibacteria group bacterium]
MRIVQVRILSALTNLVVKMVINTYALDTRKKVIAEELPIHFMKLSNATNEQKTKALAELDGWTQGKVDPAWWSKLWSESFNYTHATINDLPHHSTSYDAIIPLIQKQGDDIILKAIFCINGIYSSSGDAELALWKATPSQLADALLVATGKVEL